MCWVHLFIHPDREEIFHIVILLHWKAAFSGRLLILSVTSYSKEYIIVILLEKIGLSIDKLVKMI